MHILLCDDDKSFISAFESQIMATANSCSIAVTVTGFTSVEELLAEAELKLGDSEFVCFLDIDMPGLTGFDAAEKLRLLNRQARIVFVSNKDELVFQSLEYHPFFFLRKSRLNAELKKQLLELDKLVHPKHIYETFQTGRQTIQIEMDMIAYAESEKNYLVLHHGTTLQETRVRLKISEAEERWRDYGFIRIHKGILVNSRYIGQLVEEGLRLTTGANLPVARSSMASLKQVLFEVQKNG